jgi:hypothetical protein
LSVALPQYSQETRGGVGSQGDTVSVHIALTTLLVSMNSQYVMQIE